MDIEEEIKKLEEEIKSTQYNKATEKHIGILKARIAKLRREMEKEKKKKKKKGKGIKKSGDASITTISFDTFEPKIKMINYRDAKIQLVIFPRIDSEALSFINSSDLFIYDDSLDPSELEKVKVDKLKVNINVENLDLEIEKIYEKLNLIRVFTKKDKEGGPLTLRRGSTIKDVCEKIHKDLLKNFKYAIVNGKSVKFKNQRVGLEHVVEDGDVITIFAR